MDAWVKADEQGIDMEFYNSLGAGMGSFSFNREGVSFSSALFPSSFKAEYLAADFQLCFYRSGALERELAKSALGFGSVRGEAAGGEGGEIRRVFEGGETGTGKTLIEIEKTGTSVTYTNFVRGYSFTIRSAGEAR